MGQTNPFIEGIEVTPGVATARIDELRRALTSTVPLCDGLEVQDFFDDSVHTVAWMMESMDVDQQDGTSEGGN